MRPSIASLTLALCVGLCACSGGDKDSFRNVDHDKNGKISYEELLFVFPDVTPDLFAQTDTNHDGSLSEDEYNAFLKGEAAAAKAAPRASGSAAGQKSRTGDAGQLSVPYKGEEVIEIPAPGSDQPAKGKADRAKKDAKAKAESAKGDTDKKGEAFQYTIQRGDNLSRLAHKYGISVDDITRANGNMNPDTLRDGQVITIPARP